MTKLHELMSSAPDETRHGIDLLVNLAWEDERTDIHGIAIAEFGHTGKDRYVKLECYCGTAVTGESDDEALKLLEGHARMTCAACHGPKPSGTFPRCAEHAF